MLFLPQDSWEIHMTPKKGRGIFATKDISAGTIIGDYIGKVLKTAEEDVSEKDGGLFLLYYHDYASLYPTDIAAPGVHCINHSCTPNSWIRIYKGHTLFFALRHIFPGEEITISYLLRPKDACDPCTHICTCESMVCTGSMHLTEDFFTKWRAFSDTESAQTQRARIRYGKVLPLLATYPKEISDNSIYPLFGNRDEKPYILMNKKLPPVEKLRTYIRESGKTLFFPDLATTVYGIKNGEVVTI